MTLYPDIVRSRASDIEESVARVERFAPLTWTSSFLIRTLSTSPAIARFQPRRRMIALAADGCKSLLALVLSGRERNDFEFNRCVDS